MCIRDSCTTNLAETCPPECLSNLVADGGNSGYGAKYVVKTKLEYDPEGQQDSVVFNPTYDETTLTIGTKEAKPVSYTHLETEEQR